MNVDQSMLGRQAGMLPLGYQNIKQRIHSWVNIFLNMVASMDDFEQKILDTFCTVDTLMILEAI